MLTVIRGLSCLEYRLWRASRTDKKTHGFFMGKKNQKKEALSVGRLIMEVLVEQLGIPFRNIVNDTTFSSYTGSKRPDLTISNVEYKGDNVNEYIQNLLCYVEAKDTSCNIDDSEWRDAFEQGKEKSLRLGIPFFGVTNCKTTYFYNRKTGERLKLNGNLISEFQTLDVFRIIRKKLKENPGLSDIRMGVDSLSSVSEAVFNKKLWELKEEYREIDFASNTQKIDFTIGMIALEYFEEKAEIDNKKDSNLQYWSDGKEFVRQGVEDKALANKLQTMLVGYIDRLIGEDSEIKEFSYLLENVKNLIYGNNAIVGSLQLQTIYPIIDSMKPMHGAGFDLFGAVYENFANSKEKKDFGEYFTRRHYSHVLAELLLKDEDNFREIKIIDPACGTGGMLTESFKVLKSNYEESGTYNEIVANYLSNSCFYGVDIRTENVSRSRLNMFLVGDGHTNMFADNSLKPEKTKGKEILKNGQYDYVITNPPYGAGTILAETDALNSNRMEVAFICKIIDLLKINGKACIITPDGILENPSFKKLREEILLVCHVEAIISLPVFAFAPYTKEKTYAIFIQKKHERNYNAEQDSKTKKKNLSTGKMQSSPIWMYIIDNDGFANSDKRFPTRLRGANQEWLHDEVSGYSDKNGVERRSLLVQNWKIKDDTATGGTIWMTEKGQKVKMRKCGHIPFESIGNNSYYSLLPENYLRPHEPRYIDASEFVKELNAIENELNSIKKSHRDLSVIDCSFDYKEYQVRNVPVDSCIGHESGNTGLTEEFIYSTLLLPGERYKVRSSSTSEETLIGYVPRCMLNDSPIKINTRSETLIIARNGNAGQTEYLVNERYAINDHAYILYVKEDCPYKINLKWFSIQYRSEIMSYTSSSANGTWNMTGFFNDVVIDIPNYDEQLKIVQLYEKAEDLRNCIGQLTDKLSSLLKKEIC